MSKGILHSVGLILLSAFLSISASFSATQIDTIDIQVVLDSLGNGHVQERWDVVVDDNMTEWYLSMKNLGEMTISEFKVYDHDKDYYLTEESPWDVDLSRKEKAGKCGVNPLEYNDCELCWGVGTSGRHRWTAEYTINGLVKRYDDGCGFNHCFVNYGLSSEPQFVRTTISRADSVPITAEDSQIWGFRYHGTILFEEGKVVAVNEEPLGRNDAMVIMCILPQEAFHPILTMDESIESMKGEALSDSDYTSYDYDEPWYITLLMVLGVFVGGALLIGAFYVGAALALILFVTIFWNVISLRPLRIFIRRQRLMSHAESPYYREVPIGGNLNRAFQIIDENNYRIWPMSKDNLLAAYIVRMMRYRILSITTTTENGKMVNRMKISSKKISFKEENSKDAESMRRLHRLMMAAAGTNLILEKGELKQYIKKHKSMALELVSSMQAGDTKDCQPEEYEQVAGLENFLRDFTIMQTRGMVDVELWDEYLVYATLYGISKRVLKEIQKQCPEYFDKSFIGAQLINKEGDVMTDFVSFTGISHISHNIASTSSSSSSSYSGGGGRSSYSGGGGHSGGGGGGGGR